MTCMGVKGMITYMGTRVMTTYPAGVVEMFYQAVMETIYW